MPLLGTDFLSTVPADNTAAKLGALWIRDIKTRLKAFLKGTGGDAGMFDLDTGAIVSGKVTSAMLATATGAAAVAVSGAPSLGSFTYTQCEFNAQGQLVKGQRGGLVAADYAAGSVGTAALATGAVTQLILADAEVTAEKFLRPRKWVRYDSSVRALSSCTRVGTLATANLTAHGYLVGDSVTITGGTPTQYNGTFTINSVATNSFTYTMASDPGGTTTTASVVVAIQAGSFYLTGASVTVALSGVAGTVTATTSGAHGYAIGDRVRISGSTAAGFNGEHIVTVLTSTVFTYAAAGTSSSGTTRCLKLARDITVVRNSAGNCTLTFANAFPDVNYGVWITAIDTGSSAIRTGSYGTLAVGSAVIMLRGTTFLATDEQISVLFTS